MKNSDKIVCKEDVDPVEVKYMRYRTSKLHVQFALSFCLYD